MGNIKLLLGIGMTKARGFMSSISRELVKRKHNNRSDVCFVFTSENGNINFNTGLTHGTIEPNKVSMIRRMVGDNIVRTYGPPLNKEEIPIVYLALMPSAIKTLGIKEAYDFYINWKGSTEAVLGDNVKVIAVKYK